jgi:hypothetical protein
VESNWVHSARQWPIGLLYLPRVIMRMENLVEWWLAGETELLRENLPQCHFVYRKSEMTSPGANSSHCGGKPATNRLSYGMAWAGLHFCKKNLHARIINLLLVFKISFLYPVCGLIRIILQWDDFFFLNHFVHITVKQVVVCAVLLPSVHERDLFFWCPYLQEKKK